MTPDPLNQLLAGQAARLVHENFTSVTETWWWERRIGGGIAICQTLDPEGMANEVSEITGHSLSETKKLVARELGLDDFAPITLTFEVPGDITDEEAAKVFNARSSTRRGIAEGVFRTLEAAANERNP